MSPLISFSVLDGSSNLLCLNFPIWEKPQPYIHKENNGKNDKRGSVYKEVVLNGGCPLELFWEI